MKMLLKYLCEYPSLVQVHVDKRILSQKSSLGLNLGNAEWAALQTLGEYEQFDISALIELIKFIKDREASLEASIRQFLLEYYRYVFVSEHYEQLSELRAAKVCSPEVEKLAAKIKRSLSKMEKLSTEIGQDESKANNYSTMKRQPSKAGVSA